MNLATYDIDKLIKVIPNSEHQTVIVGNGGIDLTISTIVQTVNKNVNLLNEFAEAIKGNSLKETSYNIWHFIKTNIKYVKDKPLTEEIRTPQRTLSDKIGDCDDYSIFAATILKALGYNPFFYVVAFNGSSNYGHIYVGVNNIIVDGVMKTFNEHPENITKTMIVNLNNNRKVIYRPPNTLNISKMVIQQLSGIDDANDTTDLIDSEFERLNGLQDITEDEKDDFNIVKTLKLLKGTPERDFLLNVMPAVAGIDEDMNIYFHNEDDTKKAEELFNEFQQLKGLGDIAGLDGFFKKLKSWSKKTKEKLISAHKKQVEKAKKAWKKAKNIAKKVTKVVKKVSLAPARGAILLLLKLNLFKWGSRLWLSYLPLNKVKAAGMDLKIFKKLVEFRKKFERFFEKAGGNKKAIFKAVSGKGARKAKAKYGISGTDNLGVVVAAATGGAVASASPFLAFLGAAWGAIKLIFKNLFKKGGLKKVKEGGKMIVAAYSKFKDAKKESKEEQQTQQDFENVENYSSSDDATDKGSNKMMLPLIAVGILALMKFL